MKVMDILKGRAPANVSQRAAGLKMDLEETRKAYADLTEQCKALSLQSEEGEYGAANALEKAIKDRSKLLEKITTLELKIDAHEEAYSTILKQEEKDIETQKWLQLESKSNRLMSEYGAKIISLTEEYVQAIKDFQKHSEDTFYSAPKVEFIDHNHLDNPMNPATVMNLIRLEMRRQGLKHAADWTLGDESTIPTFKSRVESMVGWLMKLRPDFTKNSGAGNV